MVLSGKKDVEKFFGEGWKGRVVVVVFVVVVVVTVVVVMVVMVVMVASVAFVVVVEGGHCIYSNIDVFLRRQE